MSEIRHVLLSDPEVTTVKPPTLAELDEGLFLNSMLTAVQQSGEAGARTALLHAWISPEMDPSGEFRDMQRAIAMRGEGDMTDTAAPEWSAQAGNLLTKTAVQIGESTSHTSGTATEMTAVILQLSVLAAPQGTIRKKVPFRVVREASQNVAQPTSTAETLPDSTLPDLTPERRRRIWRSVIAKAQPDYNYSLLVDNPDTLPNIYNGAPRDPSGMMLLAEAGYQQAS